MWYLLVAIISGIMGVLAGLFFAGGKSMSKCEDCMLARATVNRARVVPEKHVNGYEKYSHLPKRERMRGRSK